MAREISPYEGPLDRLNGRTCLGRVISVDSDSRTCRVKTLGAEAFGTDDMDLPNVKVQHFAWHPQGDYAVAIPRIGSYVLISFINSEPVVIGTYPISNTEGGGGRDNQEKLLPGDFAFVTVAGSSVIVRSAGTVEIKSTPGCRTYWLPSTETINTVCENFELEPTGGHMHWTVDQKTGTTVLDVKAFDNFEVSNAIRLQLGGTSSKAMLDLQVGSVDDNLDIATTALALQMQADGTTTLVIGDSGVSLTITPDGKVSLTAKGDVSVSAQGKVDVQAGGDANITAGGNITATGSKIILNGSGSGVTTKNSHQGVIDLITGAPVQPSTTVFADV